MTHIKDISEKKYRDIIESTYTPLKLRADWLQKTRDQKPAVQLFITKNFELGVNEYFLMIGIPSDHDYVILSFQCEQPPTFVISDICHIIVNNFQHHSNNSYLINQYLNGSGYKNLEHIVLDIFTQEMMLKMSQHYLTDTAILFNDYSYLIQKAMTDVQTTINTLNLSKDSSQSYFFFMLAVEESIAKLNQEFMFLYFCFYKLAEEARLNKGAWRPLLKNLKRIYLQKIDHHIHALKQSLEQHKNSVSDANSNTMESISLQLEHLLGNLELFQKKEAYLNQPLFVVDQKVP